MQNSYRYIFTVRLIAVAIMAVSLAGCQSAKKTIECNKAGRLKYELLDKTLHAYVRNGSVDYRRLKANHRLLDEFVDSLKCIGPKTSPELMPSDKDRIAFWINAHNAIALREAVKRYPCKSVYSFWQDFSTSTQAYVDGKLMSLKEIADAARRAGGYDPRIEFALSIPAMGSPKLQAEIYKPEKLDDQLDNAVHRALKDNKLIYIDHEGWSLRLGRALWNTRKAFIKSYEKIFHTTDASIIDALAVYADDDQRRRLNTAVGYNIKPLQFDWTLNDGSQPPCSLDNLD